MPLRETVGGLIEVLEELKAAWNEDLHPRDNAGRFASKPGGTDALRELLDLDVPERKKRYLSMTPTQRRKIANAEESVPARIRELVGPSERRKGETAKKYAARRFEEAGGLKKNERQVVRMADSLERHLKAAAGSGKREQVDALVTDAVDAVIAQELEATGRTLGDHGVRHLLQDAEWSEKIHSTLPTETRDTDLSLLYLAGAYHDTGYLTPPSRSFIDEEHPEQGVEHYNANVREKVAAALGDDAAAQLERIIATHADTEMDWQEDPVASAFRLSDNLALFQDEKLPNLAWAVPANKQVMVDLAEGDITLNEAKDVMHSNVDEMTGDISDTGRELLHRAIDEFSVFTPKFLVGQLGGRVLDDQISWDGESVVVPVQRSDEDVNLGKILDLGQKQFVKLAETYGTDIEDWKDDNEIVFEENGQPVVRFVLTGETLKMIRRAQLRALLGR